MVNQPGIVLLDRAAKRLCVKVRTVRDTRWRKKVGLPLIRVGGRLVGVFEADLSAVLERGRERFQPDDAA
jgi:Mg-chelatase subunit ChlI